MMDLFSPLKPWPFNDLLPHHYNLIVADPPWLYEHYSLRGIEKSAQKKYRCYDAEEISDMFPIGELADVNCLLLCFATFPLIDRQIACVKAWGFEYKSMFIWHKVFPSGKTAMGPGYRVRSMAEPIIVATRGEPQHRPFPGLFKGIRREHSRKPEEFYKIVDKCCPNLSRRADLFVRTMRPRWHAFGDQKEMFSA